MEPLDPHDYYLLRWRFDFHTGSCSLGLWSHPGNIVDNGAWRQAKPGLTVVRAAVEGKHNLTRQTVRLVDVPGQDFVKFDWDAIARLNPFAVKGAGGTPLTTLSGISVVTREDIITVDIFGNVTTNPRPEAHKRIAFATY